MVDNDNGHSNLKEDEGCDSNNYEKSIYNENVHCQETIVIRINVRQFFCRVIYLLEIRISAVCHIIFHLCNDAFCPPL